MESHIEMSSLVGPTLAVGVLESLMSQVVESAPSGVVLMMMDGRILLVNTALERMFGYSRSDLLDSRVERLMPERFRSDHATYRGANWDDFIGRDMGAGRELFGLRADGSEFPIEIGTSALQTFDGTMVVMETIVDISVRKRLERMFRRIVEAAPYGMVMVDALGSIALVNPQAEMMFGYAASELIGNPLEMLLPERVRSEHGRHRAAFAAAPSMRQMGVGRDLTARHKDGSEFPVEIALNPIAGEEGGLVLAAVTDITRRKATQRELRQANANLEEFTYAASHDLKSPLRGIADLVEWIIDDLAGMEMPAINRNLSRISDRIKRLERVIDDLLAYAHAETTSTDAVAVELPGLVNAVLAMLPQPPGIQIAVQVDAEPFITNRIPLESVLRNLINNAMKHHDLPQGRIDLKVKDNGGYCVFTVSDDGPGIPPEAHDRVFRIFQTLAGGSQKHSGIGLALSKRLAEANGGWITLDSAQGTRGATFSVWWPRFQWRKPQ